MDTQSIETGGVIVLALGLLEVIKMLVAKRRNGKEESPSECKAIFPVEQRDQLKNLYTLHNQFTDDGAPKWFIPGSLAVNQAKMVEILNVISRNQEGHAKIMEDHTKVLEKIAGKLT